MKKIYFLLSAATTALSSIAQPTLTGLQLNPVIGETIMVSAGDFADHGTNGSNQSWNFSNLSTFGASGFTVTPSTSAYPGTNMAYDYDGVNIIYGVFDATQQAFKYINSFGTIYTFSDSQRFIPLPLNSSTNSTDSFLATYTDGVNYIRSGSSAISYKGFGTLTTPFGTYLNCLKIELTQSSTDTYTEQGGGVIEYETTAHYWFAAGYHHPILSLISSLNDGDLIEYSQIFNSSSLGISENIAENYVVYPNPTTNELNIAIPNTSGDVSLTVINMNSQVVSKETIRAISNEYTISVSNLDSGIYFVAIELADGTVARKKFQKI